MFTSRQNLQTPDYIHSNGNFSLGYHTDMIRDRSRVGAFEKALKQVVKKGDRVLEIGCGSGILSIIAASCGASVTALEADKHIAKLAKKNFDKHNNLDITLIEGDAVEFLKEFEGEKFDVIVAELMSIWCIEEPQVPIVNLARKKALATNGVVIPTRISNFMAIGNFDFGNELVECVYPIARFTGIPDAVLLSETKLVNSLDFYDEVSIDMEGEVVFDVYASGEINCVQISSLVELVDGVTFYTSNTLMPVSIVPLKIPIEVKRGDRVVISYAYRHRSALESAIFIAKKIDE